MSDDAAWARAAPAIAAALPELAFLIGPGLDYAACNHAEHADLHAPWATLQGRPLASVGPPALARRLIAACQSCEIGRPQRLAYALRTLGGRAARFEASLAPLPGGGWLCVVRDVGPQFDAAAEQARYARAMRGAADGLWEWEPASGQEYLSPRGIALLGGPGRLAEQLCADDLPLWRAALQSHLRHGAPLDIELRLAAAPGQPPRWLRCRGWSERDARGQPVRVLATLSDVSVAKATELALAESQSKFRALFHTVPVGIALIELAGGTVVEANDELARMLGTPAPAMAGRAAAALGLAPLPPASGRTVVDDLVLCPTAGRWLHAKLVAEPVTLGGRALLLCALVDISVQVRAEAGLQALAEQLMDQERHTSRHIAQALHDRLGQTLAALRLMLDLGAPQAREQARGLVDQALREVREVLVDLRPPLLEDEGLAAALDNELAQRRALHPGLALSLDADSTLLAQRWPARAEYACLMVAREALENALSHARAGAVCISLHGGPDEIVLGIADDGIGLPPDCERRPGHLGLVGMRERARAIGARLELGAADAGRGTRISLHWNAPA